MKLKQTVYHGTMRCPFYTKPTRLIWFA